VQKIDSWIPVPPGSDFTLENLPYGAFLRNGAPHLGVAIGEQILDLHELAGAGFFDGVCDRELLQQPVLNQFLAAGRAVWKAVRDRITSLLRAGGPESMALRSAGGERFLIEQREAAMVVPMHVGDYVDFYSSLEHAKNLGRFFRPDSEPLLPNWRWLPVGYHGRSSTIVIDGTPIRRPCGQRKPPDAAAPLFGPTTRLDIELEVGFVTGPGNRIGTPIPIEDARNHIFGLVLVNDWSARDIQAWEYQPLGPFLGKSFATTISPWIVTLDALEPFRKRGPVQDPSPLPHLSTDHPWAFDINLAVDLQTQAMRERGIPPETISKTNYDKLYWNIAQQLAHVTSNGTVVRPGDLYASGTLSGAASGEAGSLIELTENAARPLRLRSGEERTFLEDGDEATLRGWSASGDLRVGFGQARGRIIPAN
jgi:fumarylacetoacetase